MQAKEEVGSDDEIKVVKPKQVRKIQRKKEKEVVLEPEQLKKPEIIPETITENKLKKLLPKMPRSEKQIEQTKKIIDLRKNKLEEGITLKVIPKKKREKKILPPASSEARLQPPADSDASTEESEPDTDTEADYKQELQLLRATMPYACKFKKQPTSFKAAKPIKKEILKDDVDEAEEKLNKINSLLYSNPYYAQIIASRQRK